MRKQEFNEVEIISGKNTFDIQVNINGKDIAKEIIGFGFKLIAGEYPQLIAYYPVGKFKIESAKTDTIYENR
jgi:hypothetical protein